MAISIYNLKKWFKMIFGKSIYHVKQGEGNCYNIDDIKGYYNDLTLKVLNSNLKEQELPVYEYETNKRVEFSIQIIQYGLGAYDLFLLKHDKSYLNRFYNAVNWVVNNTDSLGGIDTFGYLDKNNKYSSMAQGQAASLLMRAYVNSGDEKYYYLTKKIIDFMLKSVDDGGTSIIKENEIYLMEYTNMPLVLNGFIFSLFGIYDVTKVCKEEKYKEILKKCCKGVEDVLPSFDLKYWSKYDIDGKIASPFYHDLHVSLLSVLYKITSNEQFDYYKKKFAKYSKNPFYRFKAFTKKAFQKIKE